MLAIFLRSCDGALASVEPNSEPAADSAAEADGSGFGDS